MFINYVWAGPPPEDLSIVLTNPIKLARILNERGRTQPQWLQHQINFWCFHQFIHEFNVLFHRAANFDIYGHYIDGLVQINIRSINNLLNDTDQTLGLDKPLINDIKYCLEVSEMIRSFNLMKEIITPLILAFYPGYYADTTVEFNEHFRFPSDGFPKIPRVGKMHNKTRRISTISIYTITTRNVELCERFKKYFNVTRRDQEASSSSNLIHVPGIDVWFIFCPPSMEYRKIFMHLVRALCTYIMNFCPPFAHLECDLFPGHLERMWRIEGLPLLSKLLEDGATSTNQEVAKQFRLLAQFLMFRDITSMSQITRNTMLGDLISDPYIEVFCFLYPGSELGAFHSPNFIYHDALFSSTKSFLAGAESRHLPTREQLEALDYPGSPSTRNTIWEYGIIKSFGASGWRKMPAPFLDLSETPTLIARVREKLAELRNLFPDEKTMVRQEFEEFLRSK